MSKQDSETTTSVLDSHGTDKALELLAALKKNPAGMVIYRQVERVLHEAEFAQLKVVQGYAAMTQALLNTFREQLPKSSLLYLELKLIQKRLAPPITLAELVALHAYIKKAAKIMGEVSEMEAGMIQTALEPLLEQHTPDKNTLMHEMPATTSTMPAGEPYSQPEVEQQINSVYRHKLNQQHRDILELQTNLAKKVTHTSSQFDEFESQLRSTLQDLQNDEKHGDLDSARDYLKQKIKQLLDSEHNLTTMLNDTQSYLQLIGTNSQKLSEELDQVRVLSLTDDLTGLPNRRAFLRRLEDEMHRGAREKTPLTLAILDLDNFKDINDKYGHNIGDEMLRTYASDILSIFRRYDMVARYGGEEFGIILPNTDKDGAMRAFSKVHQQAAATYCRNAGGALHVPTFSAGLAIYRPGESLKSLIERADMALYKAKQNGRNRLELDTSYLGEPATLTPEGEQYTGHSG